MRPEVLTALLLVGSMPVAAQPAPRESPQRAGSEPLAEARSRVVPQSALVQGRSAAGKDDLRTLLKSQTAAIEDLSNRLDQMEKRLMQLEKRER